MGAQGLVPGARREVMMMSGEGFEKWNTGVLGALLLFSRSRGVLRGSGESEAGWEWSARSTGLRERDGGRARRYICMWETPAG